jgi:hypothetical protein
MGAMTQSLKIAGIGLGLACTLTGCSAMKSALGMDKRPPDEFAIVTKAPLVVPPDFALRPPRPGAQDTQELTSTQSAAQTVFGREVEKPTATGSQSPGEVALLESAGADRADAGIRDQVAADNKSAVTKGDSLTDRLMFWKGEKEDATVDHAAEAERIRNNEATGQAPAEGAPQASASADPAPATKKKGGFFSHLWPF